MSTTSHSSSTCCSSNYGAIGSSDRSFSIVSGLCAMKPKKADGILWLILIKQTHIPGDQGKCNGSYHNFQETMQCVPIELICKLFGTIWIAPSLGISLDTKEALISQLRLEWPLPIMAVNCQVAQRNIKAVFEVIMAKEIEERLWVYAALISIIWSDSESILINIALAGAENLAATAAGDWNGLPAVNFGNDILPQAPSPVPCSLPLL